MGVPPEMEVCFSAVDDAGTPLQRFANDSRMGIVLVGDINTMLRLVSANPQIKTVNIGGVHHSPGRVAKLRYVFLTPDEEAGLRAIAAAGVEVTAQDVPGARPISLDEVLTGEPTS